VLYKFSHHHYYYYLVSGYICVAVGLRKNFINNFADDITKSHRTRISFSAAVGKELFDADGNASISSGLTCLSWFCLNNTFNWS